MNYRYENGLYFPMLRVREESDEPVGKYGDLRLEYLREYKPVTFYELLLDGKLHAHLLETDRAVRSQIEETMQALIRQTALPDRCTDPLGWAQQMNALHAQAEETALPLLYE